MKPIESILVTTDFSQQALPGVKTAAGLAAELGAHLVLLYVVEDHLPPLLMAPEARRDEILEEHRRAAEERLEDYAADHSVDAEARTAVGSPSKEILRVAEQIDADLVVMSSHGYGPVAQVLLGSTSERVIHGATCPVVVVPSKERPR